MNAFFNKIAFLFFVFGFQIIVAQNSIVLDTKEVGTTTNFDFEIGFNNTDEVSALQFDILYNEEVLELATGHSVSTRASNHTLAVSHPAEGVIRVILYSSNNEAIQGSSGVLATLKLKTKTLPGNFSLSTTNLVASLADQTAVEVNASAGSIKVLGSILQMANPNINFGRVPLGSSTQRSLSVQNTGTTDLILTGVNVISPFSIQQSFPITISPNASQNLTVTINTANKYKDSETLNFQNNDADALRSQSSVNIEAEVYAVNEIKIGSGNGEINTEIEIPVVIENMEPFNGFQFDIQLPNDISYVENSVVTTNRLEDHNISASVVNGNILRFLAYSPTNKDFQQTGGEVFSFKLKPNVSSGTYQLRILNAILTHTTLGNILSDAYNGSIRINSPNLYINPSIINYNNVPITETRNTVIRLTNYGDAQLNINDIIYDATELSLDISAPIVIDAGQSKNVNLTFNPSSSGSFSETIAFRHNAANTQNIVNISAQKFSPNYLKVVDQQAKFNTTNLVEISLENNDDIKAAQFDVQLPEGFVLDLNGINTINRASQFTAAASNVSGNTYRVVLYSASGNTIAKGTGAILQLPITLQNTINAGNYSFSFSDVILSDENNNNTSSIALEQGVITVVEEGSVQVTLAPNAINSLGGQWRISGGDWQNSGTTLSDLEVGNYTIEFKEVANWNKPTNENITVSKNQLTEVTGTYADPDSPTVVISSDASNPTNTSFTATFTFSENVTGFTIDDISATNATVSNFISSSASNYTALISPTTNGVIALNIAEGVAQDAANNGNNEADQFSITYDNTKPTVEISSTASGPTNTLFTATFTFSEDVTDFEQGDITLNNATLSNFTSETAKVYSATITPTTDGIITIDVSADVASDAAGNGNNASDQFSITYDNTKPTVEISSTASDPTNTLFTATFTFSEDVTGFEQGDISLGNATLSNFTSTNAKVYMATITPTTDGAVTINVSEDVANDSAGNGNSAASQFGITYDNTKPTVEISSTVSNPTNTSFTATFTFSEDVTGFEEDDIFLTNATLSNFTSTSAKVYTAMITPSADGTVTIDISDNVGMDVAGNGNSAASQFSITYDNTKPTVEISSTVSDPTNTSFTATFTFSEEVTGFEIGDIVLNNATISNFASSSGKVYSALITPTSDGDVAIDVNADVAADAAGNKNSVASQFSIIFDITNPSVTISSTVSNPTQDPFTATITFSEEIIGFTLGDILATNATLSSFASMNSKEYTVLVSPLAVGEVILNISSGIGQDNAGNENTSASEFSTSYIELGNLQVTLSPTVISSLGGQWRISNGDWQNSGTTLFDLAAGSYTIEFKEVTNWNTPSNKQVIIQNKVSTQSTGVYEDPTKPTVEISSDATNPTNTIFTAMFTFSEDVTDFEQGDITLNNATLSNFTSETAKVYSATITPTTDGIITIDVSADVASDAAGNGNNASDQFSITYDNTKPTVEISSTASDPTNTLFTATFTFSEDVTGFEQGDISLGNATLSNFTSTNAKVYMATITPTTDGAVTINVSEDVANDSAGNGNSAASQFGITYDNTKPTVEISSTVSNPTNTSFTATFTFSEDVTGFEEDDIFLTNATLSNFTSTSAKVYTAMITPSADGTVTIDISDNVGMDVAGNGNSAASQFSITYDNTKPTVEISSTVSDPTNTSFTATFTFSEEVTGFEIGDIVLNNATISNFASSSGKVYSALITPTSDGDVAIDVNADVAADAAGNKNSVASQFSIIFDITNPSVTISSTVSNPTQDPFTATITFSEEIIGFTLGDILATNATLSSFASMNSKEYTVLVSPLAVGEVILNISSGIGQDNAGNENTSASEFSTSYIELGNLQVTLSPTVISSLGGQWRISNGDWQNSGTTLFDLAAGSYTIEFKEVTNWNTPSNKQVIIQNKVSTQSTGVYEDPTKPTVEISSDATNPTNTIFTAMFTFSEDVTDFEQGDITLNNATLSNFTSETAKVYSATITPTTDGIITIDVSADVASDAAGNGNNASDQFSITYDNTKPTVEISSTASDPTNTLFTATFTFSEDVTGFEQGDISLGNATLSNFTSTNAKVYMATITPTTDGAVTINVSEDVANDSAGNGNSAASQFGITYDNTKPTVEISSTVSNPTNTSFTATFTFSEDVTGFEEDDIFLTNATLSNFTSTSAKVYTAMITPSADGTVTIDISDNVGMDVAGNGNSAASQFSITYDNTKPTVEISSTVSDPTNTSFTATFTFSEEVTGFEIGDIVLNNATISNFASSSGKVYSALITPTSDGDVAIDVNADVAADAAGNKNSVASQFSIIFDITNPSVTISSTVSNPTQDPFTATITFSEDISGFTLSDIVGVNATLSSFMQVNAKEYSILVSPLAVGEVTLDISSGVAKDSAGNDNAAATQFSTNYIELGDLQVILSPSVINTLGGQWRISGGEWQNSGITLSNLDAGDYTIEFKDVPNWNTPDNKLISIINNELTDVSATYEDPNKPTVLINSDASGFTNSVFTAIFIFSEDVTEFENGDITVNNATVSNFSATSGSVYSVLITPSTDGEITIDVNANVVQDAAGNGNNAADQFSIIYDGIKPTVEISSTVSDPTNTSFTANFTFSEEVTGFELGDIILNNATISNFTSSSGKIYTALITPISDGEVAIEVNGEVAQDAAGNKNLASDQFSLIFDAIKPTAEISSTVDNPTNSSFTATFTFSEDVSGFEGGDIIVDNATISNFSSSSSKNYSATITPIVDGEVTIDVNADVAQDTAGNFNTAANQFSITFDSTLDLDNYNKIDFQIYPNPVNREINISSDFEISKIELYSINGKKILSLKHSKLIDVTNLATGFYFVRIYFSDKIFVTKRFLKN